MLQLFSDALIPLLVLFIVLTGLLKKRNIYEDFINGAKDGIYTAAKILPTLAGLMIGVGIMRGSGLLGFLTDKMSGFADYIHFPSQLIPLTVVKMFSSSAATGLLLDIYQQYGTDSRTGISASLMMSSTETIFYTMSIYFLTVRVKKTRWTLPGALAATMAGTIASIWLGSG